MEYQGIPVELHPPVSLALAKAVERFPAAGTGSWLFEPKWDGFRILILAGSDQVSLWSRQTKDMTRYFPDLVAAVAEQMPPGCVVDGEALVFANGRLDFASLQQRMTTSKAILPALARARPALFAAFDLLAVAGHDIRGVPLSDRRALLEELANRWAPPLNLSPATTDQDVAAAWLEEMSPAGVEGIMIKPSSQRYEGGQRIWSKLKTRTVLDVVCAAVLGSRAQPSAIVAGLPIGGRLRIVGRSSPLSARTALWLARYLQRPAGDHPWPAEISPGVLERFSKDKDPVRLTRVEPLVVEVFADVAWSGRSFRHPLRFHRPRPDLDPHDVEVPDELRT